MEDIFEQYSKLSRTFSDENLDVKKAEQSLFLIETNLNNLLTRETQISNRFLEYKDRFLQRDNLTALDTYILNLEDSSQYDRLKQQSFDESPIDTNILLFSKINSLLDSIQKSNESLKVKETLITHMSKIATNLNESEKAFANLKNNQQNNVTVDELARLKARQNQLVEDLTLLTEILETQQMKDHPFLTTLENKANEWAILFENQFNLRIKKVLRSELNRVVISTDELTHFTQNKAFFDGNRKISDSLIELIGAISTSLIDSFKKDAKLSLDVQKKYIYISEDEAFYDMDEGGEGLAQLKIAQIFSNFEVVYDASQTIKDITYRNISLASLKKEIQKTFEKFDASLLQALNDAVFPHIREGKDNILSFASQIEEKYKLNLQSLKEVCENFEFIEIFNANEKYLVEWKNDFFAKIQSIQANSDSKTNESFYRTVVEVVEKLKGFTTSFSQITDQELQKKFVDFEVTTLKLIVLVIKIVDEENTRKKMQWQILNLRSSCFVVIQDLILVLLTLTHEKNINELYNEELMKFVRYFNAQEIDTWIDFKNLNINST